MKKTKVYLHSSKEYMYEKAEELGLSEEATQKFKYACSEVELTVEVDEKTGHAEIIAVDGRKLTSEQGGDK